MKKKYIAPVSAMICLHHSGDILISSLNDGEVGSPGLYNDDSSILDPVVMDEE